MATAAVNTTDRTTQITLAILDDLFRSCPVRDFAVRLWNGTLWRPQSAQEARCTIVLQHPGALRKMFIPATELNLGEAYIFNDFDIEGDIEGIVPLMMFFLANPKPKLEQLRYGTRLLSLPNRGEPRDRAAAAKMVGSLHSQTRDRDAISHHYNTSNDFFALWLDSRMVYTCAYFSRADDDLETAQQHKLDYVCRKLRLQPGDRLLDVGCGWGGLIMHAAKCYGARAEGINISSQQVELARARIVKAGLGETCRVHLRDYREAMEMEAYDKIAAIGAAEHVGKANLPVFFQSLWKQLRPGGVLLNHSIGVHSTVRHFVGVEFVHRYVFPDGEPTLPLSTYLDAAESAGFQVRDVENLAEHYVYTLRHWLKRYEQNAEAARKIVGEVIYRSWRMFLAVAMHEYQAGTAQLYQMLLVKPSGNSKSGLPLTRDDWYADRRK